MKKILFFLVILILSANASDNMPPATKIKNLVNIKGVRSNPLVGYGVIIGLMGQEIQNQK